MTKFENVQFPSQANTALPVNYRTYSRKPNPASPRETQAEQMEREFDGLFEMARWTPEEAELVKKQLSQYKVMPSGRWKWVGGTEFVTHPDNFYAAYNCCNIYIETWDDFAHNFNLLMQGSGVGALIEAPNVDNLPLILNSIHISVSGKYGDVKRKGKEPAQETSLIETYPPNTGFMLIVGDTRQGWVDAYTWLLKLAADETIRGEAHVEVDVSNIRAAGETIKGFGGKTNPSGFIPLLHRVTEIINAAVGRKLSSVEVSLLLNEAASCTVAGNVRRSARIDQFSWNDEEASCAKDNLWEQDSDGNWRIDPKRDALRMANHTRILHEYPTREEIRQAVEKQFYSGEGAIMFAPWAIARANADILGVEQQKTFVELYAGGHKEQATEMLEV